MLRYLRRLSDRDIALDRSMIPLGSCTMKLNAAAEMDAGQLAEFAGLHPFAPAEQAAGYRELYQRAGGRAGGDHRLRRDHRCSRTRGRRASYAGLLAIRGYHARRGAARARRLPDPGSRRTARTRPAPCMAGLQVVVVKCDSDGTIDLGDLRAKLEEHAADLAALMVDLPVDARRLRGDHRARCAPSSTRHGGQVYVDGANLNALVGLAKPGRVRRRRLAT